MSNAKNQGVSKSRIEMLSKRHINSLRVAHEQNKRAVRSSARSQRDVFARKYEGEPRQEAYSLYVPSFSI